MTEQEWLTSTDHNSLADYLVREKITSLRKLRLFVVACCRLVEHLLKHEASRKALGAAERFAEGLIKESTLVRYCRRAFEPWSLATQAGNQVDAWAALCVWQACNPRPHAVALGQAAGQVATTCALEAGHKLGTPPSQAVITQRLEGMIALLRDVVGNPFRQLPPCDPAWLEASGGLAGRLADSIYEERHFTELPILADALEDAGCTEQRLLDHLRSPGPHDRGCWALDVLLGKE
jgi:hypothetical protein